MQTILDLLDPEQISNMLVSFVPKLGAAALVFLGFWLLLRLTQPTLRAILRRGDFAEALVRLLVDNVYRFVLLGFGLVMSVSQLGIDVGAALAGLGVAGIAVGFAAQDSIANAIAGFLIFWDKPFHVGQYITTQDMYGEVTNITMRTTRIRTPENVYVILPNKQVIDSVLVNHSMFGETRVNIPVGIAYKEDVAEARKVLLAAASNIDGISRAHESNVVVTELGGSSVNLEVRVWVTESALERPVFFRTLEECKRALDEAGIEIPFPHLQLFVESVRNEVWRGAEGLVGGGGDVAQRDRRQNDAPH